MTHPAWDAVETELARTAEAGQATRFWLRDDDATEVSPALERLVGLCEGAGMPILLAVIPAGVRPELAAWLEGHPSVAPCQHGWRHTNHAGAGERACELGGARPDTAVIAEIAQGRDALCALFGAALCPILVPPWNRIRASLVDHLPALGFAALSAFSHPPSDHALGLREINCDLDIVDWRNGRRGRSIDDLCDRLARLVVAARHNQAPIGLLTHHLVHDDAAWEFLAAFFERIGNRPGVEFVSANARL